MTLAPEDLVQDAFVRVAGGDCTFAPPGFYAHLRRTIAYLARSHTCAGQFEWRFERR
ncbi:MAG TPA: hypothetical protein VKB32_10360 [Actinomycetota bacterium]|nr:hypothetical protein [Actinomycetota bacterium]